MQPDNKNQYTFDALRQAYVPATRDGLTMKEAQVVMRYVTRQKLLSVKFPTLHCMCKACGRHWLKCCYTEFSPVCVNPVNCAFEKEMWS